MQEHLLDVVRSCDLMYLEASNNKGSKGSLNELMNYIMGSNPTATLLAKGLSFLSFQGSEAFRISQLATADKIRITSGPAYESLNVRPPDV